MKKRMIGLLCVSSLSLASAKDFTSCLMHKNLVSISFKKVLAAESFCAKQQEKLVFDAVHTEHDARQLLLNLHIVSVFDDEKDQRYVLLRSVNLTHYKMTQAVLIVEDDRLPEVTRTTYSFFSRSFPNPVMAQKIQQKKSLSGSVSGSMDEPMIGSGDVGYTLYKIPLTSVIWSIPREHRVMSEYVFSGFK